MVIETITVKDTFVFDRIITTDKYINKTKKLIIF